MVASFDNSLCAICRDMGMEVESAPVQVKVADAEVPLFQDTESKATAKEREEAAVFGADNGKVAANATNDLAPPRTQWRTGLSLSKLTPSTLSRSAHLRTLSSEQNSSRLTRTSKIRSKLGQRFLRL
jgi:hypothetical protein